MRLISLHLWNIRSYTDATVEFGDGVNLFEGDIGSGKSTILLAVQFALFGLAEVASASLLRHGEKEGGVELVFSVKDRTFKATRKLGRKGSGASVKGCSLEVDGKETKLSSNEMRQQVLTHLEYGERRNPRARLDIFTYSVYTPQEEMRTVLTNDIKMRNQRKDTLRKALDLEEYELAATNLDKVRLQLDNDAAELRGMASDIGEVRSEREQVGRDLTTERERLARARTDLGAAQARVEETEGKLKEAKDADASYQDALTCVKEADTRLAKAEGEVRALTGKIEGARVNSDELERVWARLSDGAAQLEELAELEKVEAKLETLRRDLGDAVGDLERQRALMEDAEDASKRVEGLERTLKELEDPIKAISTKRKELEDLRSQGVGLEHELRRLEEETSAIDSEDEELTSLEGEATCPKCKQPMTDDHLESLLAGNQKRRREISSRLREVASQRNRVLDDIEESERVLVDLEGRSEELRHIEHDLELARKVTATLDEQRRIVREHPATTLERQVKDLETSRDPEHLADLRKRAGAIQELEATGRRLERTLEGLPDLERELQRAEADLATANDAVEEARATLDGLSKGRDEQAVAKASEEHQDALGVVSSLQGSIEEIEKSVALHEEMDSRLQREVERLEGILDRQGLHVLVSAWLKDRLIPAIRSMERSMMALMAEEMDAAASRWFGQLVEDPDLVMAIDEDFVPTVTHQDYEMDMGALSGGERTAAAFSYRLALNGLVRRNATPDQRNMLILDEPTDGFSREQLARMGNVFAELAADQVVVVSHDRELRTFADRVYMVEKSGGSSNVRQVA
jgi:exonuclease SbcC